MTADELFAEIRNAPPEEQAERAEALLAEYNGNDKALVEATVGEFLSIRQEPAEFNF